MKPFFLYYAPGACHAPHHAPKEWIERFEGRFDAGYEAIRIETLARQKEMGLVPPDTELPPVNPIGTPATRTGPKGQPFPQTDETKPWDTLSDGEKRLFSRMAEVYAGFLAHADLHIGRLLDYLEEYGLRENTIVILVSDNGASGEGGPNRSVNECLLFNGIPDDLETNLAMLGSAAEHMLKQGEWHQEQFAENTVLSTGMTQNYMGSLQAFLPGELRQFLNEHGMRVLRCGGLGSLANFCGSETIEVILEDEQQFQKFLDDCEYYDLEVLPDGPGTRQRAGLIAAAEVQGTDSNS